MTESSDPTVAIVSPLEVLAAEVGADVARIEREVRLMVTAALGEMRAEVLSLKLQVNERLAQLRDGAPGPAGEPGPPGTPAELYAPDDVAPMIGKALALLAEAPAAAPALPPPAVVNVTVPLPAPRTERTRVTKHDERGRIIEIERDVA